MRILYCVSALLITATIARPAMSAPPAPPAPPAPTPAIRPIAPAARPTPEAALAFVKAYSPSDLRRVAELTLLQREFVPGLKRDPGAAEMLETFPKLGEALTKAMEAQIDIFIVEYDERFFPRATKIVMETMSRGDVATLTAFYGSLLGRKMLASASMKMDGREVIDRALAGKDIDAGVARRQVMRAGLATIAALSPAEQKQVAAMALSPAGQHFRAAMPALVALQVELANSPGPKFVAGSKAAMAAAMKRVTEEDAAGTPKP